MSALLRQVQNEAGKNRGAANILVIVTVIASVVISVYLVFQNQNKPASKFINSSQANYLNEKWKFSLDIPEGFLVQDEADILYVVKEPTPDNETPFPEMRIKIEQGSKTTVDANDTMDVISQTAISINNIPGHKVVVSHKSYPIGNRCPIYRLQNSGIIYEFSLYECLDSSIFEPVVKSFKII